MLHRLAVVLAMSVLVMGCATTSRPPTAAANTIANATQWPLLTPAAGGVHTVRQIVHGAFKNQEATLDCVVDVQAEQMSVVGLSTLGARLFTVTLRNGEVKAELMLGVPAQIQPERLLADLQLAFWPLTSLQQAMNGSDLRVAEPVSGTRRLQSSKAVIAEVHYATPDPWNGRVWLANFEYGYSLTIDSTDLAKH